MRTARSNSRPLGGGCLPQCMLGYIPQAWAWRPPRPDPPTSPTGCEPGDPPARPHNLPSGSGPGAPPRTEFLTRFWKYYLAPTSLRVTIKIKWRQAPLNQGTGFWNQVIDLMALRFTKCRFHRPPQGTHKWGGIHENVKLVSSTVHVRLLY